MEGHDSDGSLVVPDQLCVLCRTLAATFTQEVFWHAAAYKGRDEYYIPLDSTLLGPLADAVEHHPDLASLRRSATSGCHLCALFFSARLRRENETDTECQLYVHLKERLLTGCQPFIVEMYEISPHDDEETRIISDLRLHRHPNGPTTGSCRTHVRDRSTQKSQAKYQWSTSTGSNDGYEMIVDWLQDCLKQHSECRHNMVGLARPKRFLDLFAHSDEERVQLIYYNNAATFAYATLSYCWGNRPAIRLNSESRAELTSGLALQVLPRTIRDAIKVCRNLGIRYLWVDALCIDQDNVEELAQEITQMGLIYAGSFLNIAAADSRNNGSGCFRTRDPLKCEECVVETGAAITFFSRHEQSYTPHNELLGHTELSKRAWVFQERMMSPRTLHYTREEIVWECRRRVMCHRCFDGAHEHGPGFGYDPKGAFIGMFADVSPAMKAAYFRLMWSTVVSYYSTCELSNIDDRLSALAGIAQLGYQQLHYQASYGLWLENFLDELLWSGTIRSSPAGHSSNVLHTVPSWSWASTLCKITYQNPSFPYRWVDQYTTHCAFVSRYPPVTPFQPISALLRQYSSFSAIGIHGWLRSCRALPYNLMQFPDIAMGWALIPTSKLTQLNTLAYLDSAWDEFAGKEPDTGFRWFGASTSSFSDAQFELMDKVGISKTLFFCPERQPDRSQELFCLHLKRVFGIERDPGSFLRPCTPEMRTSVTDFGIVLEPLDQSNTRFQRIGYFHEIVSSLCDRRPRQTTPSGTGADHANQDPALSLKTEEFIRNYMRHVGHHGHGDLTPRHSYSLFKATDAWEAEIKARKKKEEPHLSDDKPADTSKSPSMSSPAHDSNKAHSSAYHAEDRVSPPDSRPDTSESVAPDSSTNTDESPREHNTPRDQDITYTPSTNTAEHGYETSTRSDISGPEHPSLPGLIEKLSLFRAGEYNEVSIEIV